MEGNDRYWKKTVEGLVGKGALWIAAIATKVFQPYWKYTRTGPQNIYNSEGNVAYGTWLTRGFNKPYGHNWKLAKEKLQLPKISNKVTPVKVPWNKWVSGPRPAIKHPEWGSGGVYEWKIGGWDGK